MYDKLSLGLITGLAIEPTINLISLNPFFLIAGGKIKLVVDYFIEYKELNQTAFNCSCLAQDHLAYVPRGKTISIDSHCRRLSDLGNL